VGEAGNPEFGTVMRIEAAMGLTLSERPTTGGQTSKRRKSPERGIMHLFRLAKSQTGLKNGSSTVPQIKDDSVRCLREAESRRS